MKSFIWMTGTFLLIMLSSPAFSSYMIHLKTGGNFVTKKYWEENGQIKFYGYGGIIGVAKGLVDRIQEVPDEPEEVTEDKVKQEGEGKLPASGPEDALKKEPREGKEPATQAPEEPGSEKSSTAEEDTALEAYKLSYLDLKGQHEQANRIYWKARRAKNADAQKRALEEVQFIAGWLKDLEKQVREKNNGALPEWWK